MINTKIASENIVQNSGIPFHTKPVIISSDPASSFEQREQFILERIRKHYSLKLGRNVSNEEAKEIADNLLNFAQAIYGE